MSSASTLEKGSIESNVVWHHHIVDKRLRARLKSQKPCLIWFTGLSAAGKSTVAGLVEKKLTEDIKHTYLLDGDNVRYNLCKDLGFSEDDRVENIRRIGEVSKLFVDCGIITLCAFISPFRNDRRMVRNLFESYEFIEVFVDTSLEECERRDPKGMYKKARAGKIKEFTGIDSPYERPEKPEIHLNGDEHTPDELANQVIRYLQQNNYILNH